MSDKGRLGALVSLLAVTTCATLLAPAFATGEAEKKKLKDVDASIAHLNEGLAGTNVELKKAYAELAEAQAKLPGAQAALTQATKDAEKAEAQDAALAAKLAAAEESVRVQREKIVQAQANIVDGERKVGRIAANAYRNGGYQPSSLVALLTAPDFRGATDRYLMVDTAFQHQDKVLEELGERKGALEAVEVELASKRDGAANLKGKAEAALGEAEKARKVAADKKAAVDALVASEKAATDKIVARKAEEEAQIAALQREADALEAEIARIAEEERRKAEAEARAKAEAEAQARAAAAAAAAKKGGGAAPRPVAPAKEPANEPAKRSGKLLKPVNGRITSKYGMRMHPIYKYKRMHNGIDFGGGCGAPIRAAESGTVAKRGRAGGYGNQLVVNHGMIGGKAFASSYNHLSRFAVGKGAKVKRGQVIAYEGTTGASTGCHLHFEVFVNGKRTNPANYL